MEGEATALFIAEYLRSVLAEDELPKFTRLGRGLPTGADIEYADGLTLKRSLEGRQEW
jgi:recombination protein RecR